ncbi:hypothetical protein ACHAXR_006487 [Thalassiosira sp. AJA248-18]
MAAVLVTTCANLMGVGASRFGIRKCTAVAQSMPARSISCLAFMNAPSPSFHQKGHGQQPTATASQVALPYFSGGCKLFHSTTMLMMAKRKRNGGKRNKANLKPTQRSKSKSGDEMMQSLTNDDPDWNEILEDTEQESSVPEFSATFASTYHAPVMPKECIDALLKQGEFGELLLARKERWRKKRSINEAKKRRAGYYDGIDDEEDGEGDVGDAKEGLETSTSNEANHQQPRLFIDGTLGGGGHSQALLQQLSPGDILIGCDVDPEALATASTRLVEYLATCEYILDKNDSDDQPKCEWEEERPMFIPVQSNFRNLVSILSKVRHPISGRLLLGDRERTHDDNTIGDIDQVEFPGGVNGMLLDLGVSSHQIDTSERGFAFMKEGPLDMRMSGDSQIGTLTAADICNEFDEAAIIDILRTYGDEPRAKRLSAAIVASRPLYTTTDLVHAINSVTPTFARQKRAGLIATSARVFQALRIVVNEEDGALKEVLERVAPWALARSRSHYSSQMDSSGEMDDDGILAVLSYHSMEDKMAKRVIRDGKVDLFDRSRGRGGLERDIYGNVIDDGANNSVPFEPLSKPRKATDEEVATNKRARSATLRVATRI